MGDCSLYDFNKERVRSKDCWTEIELLNLTLVLVEYCQEYYQKANVFHRDIKPENIILMRDNEREEIFHYKFIDFGIAINLEDCSNLIENKDK